MYRGSVARSSTCSDVLPGRIAGSPGRWNPVAITVIFTSSSSASSRTMPKLICTSSYSAAARMSAHASLTS